MPLGHYEDRMSQLLDSYRKNAQAAQGEAERATLPNVRDRATEAAAIGVIDGFSRNYGTATEIQAIMHAAIRQCANRSSPD